MPKVAVRTHAGVKYVWYACPGCKHLHGVPAERWLWNGDVEFPTLSPSVRHYYTTHEGNERTTCHYHVVNGVIQFCGDCGHDLKGQSVELNEPTNVPEDS